MAQANPSATQPNVFYLDPANETKSGAFTGILGGGLSSMVIGIMVGLVLLCMAGAGLYVVVNRITPLIPRLNGVQVADGQIMQVISKEQRGANYYIMGNVEADVNGQKQSTPIEMEVDRITFETTYTGQITKIKLQGGSLLGGVFGGTDMLIELACGAGLVLFALIFGIALFRYLFVQLPGEARRYTREGKELDGQIVECTGQALDNDPDPPYRVTLRYSFTTPEGQTIEAEATNLRKDLRDKELPAPGTRIKVLYVNDSLYKVL